MCSRFSDVSYGRVGFLVFGAHNSGLLTIMSAFYHCELLTGQHKKREIQIGANAFNERHLLCFPYFFGEIFNKTSSG